MFTVSEFIVALWFLPLILFIVIPLTMLIVNFAVQMVKAVIQPSSVEKKTLSIYEREAAQPSTAS